MRENLKKDSIVIENVLNSEAILIHKEGRPSNSVICFNIFLELQARQTVAIIWYIYGTCTCILNTLIEYRIGRYTHISSNSVSITLL